MITGFYAGLLTLLLIFLIFKVIHLRMTLKVGLGDGNIPLMQQAIRAHANFIEIVPFALILMFLLEQTQIVTPWLLHCYGILLMVSRILHAFGLYKTANGSLPRFLGMFIPICLMLTAGALLILNFIKYT